MALLSGATNPAFTLPPVAQVRARRSSKVPFDRRLRLLPRRDDLPVRPCPPRPDRPRGVGGRYRPRGHGREAITLGQPVVAPFRDTRSMPDVLIAAAKELGGPTAAALPWGSFRECLEKAYAGIGGSTSRRPSERGGSSPGSRARRGRRPEGGNPRPPEGGGAAFRRRPASPVPARPAPLSLHRPLRRAWGEPPVAPGASRPDRDRGLAKLGRGGPEDRRRAGPLRRRRRHRLLALRGAQAFVFVAPRDRAGRRGDAAGPGPLPVREGRARTGAGTRIALLPAAADVRAPATRVARAGSSTRVVRRSDAARRGAGTHRSTPRVDGVPENIPVRRTRSEQR